MSLYFDSSALLRAYFQQDRAQLVKEAMQEKNLRFTSRLTELETRSVLRRTLRGRVITPEDFGRLTQESKEDFRHIRWVECDTKLLHEAAEIADQSGLRSLDALHLASALACEAEKIISFDIELNAAAKAVGMKTL